MYEKKLDELNRKIRHSRIKNDGLIHKRNSLKRELKRTASLKERPEQRALQAGTRQAPIKQEQGFVECE